MQFTTVTSLLALAASVVAQAATADFDPIFTPNKDEKIPAGSTYEVTWEAPAKYAGDKISISLIGGADQGSQVPIADIASGIDNSAASYQWAIDASLGDAAVYGLVFKLESDPSVFQYSKPFHIVAGKGDDKPTGSATKTLTKSQGVKTVHLSSSAPTTTVETVVNTTVPCTTSTSSVVSVANSTSVMTTAKASKTMITSTTVAVVSTTEAPVTVPSSETGAATRAGAGSVVLLGAVAMAFLAL